MSKDPAFLFYPNDYIGGTMGMTFEEKGAYIELLMLQFNRGHMTSHMIGQTLGQGGGQIWDKIKDKFNIDAAGLYYNQRLDIEIQKRKEYVKSRVNNIEGKNQYTKTEDKTEGHMGGHMTSHMENENISKEELLKKRESEFVTEVSKYSTKYPLEMLKAFCRYWTEPNKSRTKMKWELEKTFEIGRRLVTWAGNDKTFNRQQQAPQTVNAPIKSSQNFR
jgi:uncharacterized protein YdaU (DUF1376 family)